MADITEILRQLAYYQAGGGKPSTAEEFGKFLTGTGQALGTAAKGFEAGLDLQKRRREQSPLSSILKNVPEDYSNLTIGEAKEFAPFIRALKGTPDIQITPAQQQILGTEQSRLSPSQLKADVSIAGLQKKIETNPIRDKENLANSIVKGIKSGNIPPTFEGMGFSGVIPFIEKQLAEEGINLKKLQLDWIAHKTLTKTMNQNQMAQLQIAFNSTKNDLEPMRQLNEEFNRVGLTLANKLILKADLGGISLNPSAVKDMDQNQIAVATKFITQLNLMRDNMAVAFMRGGVPTDQAFRLTENILNPVYGSTQLGAAIDQVEVNLNLRQSSVGEVGPYVPNQQPQKPKPYSPPSKKSGKIGIAIDEKGNKARVEFDENGKIKRVLNEIR